MPSRIRTAQYAAAIVGLAISIYLTLYHYAGIPLVCSDTGIINCGSVLNSPLAYILGIPIAVIGIVFFLGEFVVLYTGNLDAITIWNLIGIGSVVYFINLERIIGKICAWCTGVHVIVVILLVLSVYEMLGKGAKHKTQG
jgi:uncharacterized membrane protein